MNKLLSPKYHMGLVKQIADVIWEEYQSYEQVKFYIKKWHEEDDFNYENFRIIPKEHKGIDLLATLHNIDEETLLKIAIDLGIETPDFIPSIPTFRSEIKTEYSTASAAFEKALKEIENHPDTAIGLCNSALESIIKEILKDDRIGTKIKGNETLYALASIILKEFRFTDNSLPKEIKTIGTSLIAISQQIETLRSEKTSFHGKTESDYVVKDSIYAYFVVNSVATVGLFLNSFYKEHYPKKIKQESSIENSNPLDDLPF